MAGTRLCQADTEQTANTWHKNILFHRETPIKSVGNALTT
jgi:hypothetical protein